MLALAVLDRILSIDRQNQWLVYICNSGYLRSLVESLRQDDADLQSLLMPQPPLLKPLYIYESKMVRRWRKKKAFLLLDWVFKLVCVVSGSADSCSKDRSWGCGAAALWPGRTAD